MASLALAGCSTMLSAQILRVPQVVRRILPGGQPPPPLPPLVQGIDALRVDFVAKSGSDSVYFGRDGYGLAAPARATLAAQAQWLLAHPFIVVRIEGHSDAADTRDHALATGARRAAAVRDFLILQGVPAAQVTTLSWGKERPKVPGISETALALNRRAVTVLVR